MSISADYRAASYWTRETVDAPTWPERDPEPEVTNRDPRPADAPADPRPVAALAALGIEHGWEVRIGYSRGWKRGQATGVYVPTETFGVWAGAHPGTGWRWCAMYERNRPSGAWSWQRITVWRQGATHGDLSVTDLKEFLKVRGSVVPAWFAAITEREKGKTVKARAAAKARPRKAKEATS